MLIKKLMIHPGKVKCPEHRVPAKERKKLNVILIKRLIWIPIFLISGFICVSSVFAQNKPEEIVLQNSVSVNRGLSQAAPEAGKTRTLVISAVGDCTLGNDVKQVSSVCFNSVYDQLGPDHFFKYTKNLFSLDDLTIANLEGVLTEKGSPNPNKTWRFRGKPEYIKMLTDAGIEAVSIANNHSRDYGEVSYEDTKANLDLYGLPYSSEDNVCVVEAGGVKVGIISIQSAFRYGDSLHDVEYPDTDYLKNLFLIKLSEVQSAGAELVIAAFHWGVENTREVSEQQQILGHFAIDNGADLVIGHHPHVLQPVECYQGRYILYSLGNFCFGGNKNPVDKQTMIWQQTFQIAKDGSVSSPLAHIVPCRVSSVTDKNDYCPTPLILGPERDKILALMNRISAPYGVGFDAEANAVSY